MNPRFEQLIRESYLDHNYNCAETMLRACNLYYNLGLKEEQYKLMAAFGGGLQSGNVCGALSGCSATLGMMLVETKAHECDALRQAEIQLIRGFRARLSDTQCAKLKAMHFHQEHRCLKTCLAAGEALEETIEQLRNQNLI